MGQTVLPPVPGLTYKREVFKASSTFTLPMTAQNKFDAVLISGGGGGGRANQAGSGYACTPGCGSMVYVTEVPCTNGTTLTITIGAGGAGATQSPATNYGVSGTDSSITGIVGNGTSTSIVCPGGSNGRMLNVSSTSGYPGPLFQGSFFRATGSGSSSGAYQTGSIGFGSFHANQGFFRQSGGQVVPQTLFQKRFDMYFSSGSNNFSTTVSSTGGPIPLLGSYLHAAVGGTGTASVFPAGGVTANTFIAGSGGGCVNSYSRAGLGGGGGAGGRSNTAALGGTGGNGSANSGGGGGAGGKNTNTVANTGIGGNGGSGLIIIGYWG
jgi:hypothetical protein